MIGAGRDLQSGLVVGGMEEKMGTGEVEAIVESNVADGGLHVEAVEAAPAFKGEVIEKDMFITEGRQIDIEVEQVIAGVDTAAQAGVVKTREVGIEQVDIVFDLFGRDDEAEVLVGGDGFGGFDIARIVFVEEGLEGGRQVFDVEFADDGPVKFVTDEGNGLIVVYDAGFEVKGVEGHALAVLIDRCIVDAGGAKEVVDIVAGEIAFEFAIELDLSVDEV